MSQLGLRESDPSKRNYRFSSRGEKGPFLPERVACVLEPGEGQGQRSEGKQPAGGAKEREAGEPLSWHYTGVPAY